jgi:hypothetical protein
MSTSHTTEETPVRITPKAAAAMKVLSDGIAAKHIWNVDFQEASDRLNREFEIAAKSIEDEVRVACRRTDPNSSSLYSITNTLSYLTSVNTLVKDYEKWLKKPVLHWNDRTKITPELLAGAQQMLEFVRSWVPVLNLKKAAKDFIVKGRKPSGKPVEERYVPPLSSLKSLDRVEKILRALVESKRANLEKLLTENYWRLMLAFFKAKMSPYKFFQMDPNLAGLAYDLAVRSSTLTSASVDWSKGAQMRSDAHSIVEKAAKRETEIIMLNYVSKNQAKLTRPIAERETRGGKLVDLIDLGMTTRGVTFQGWMALTFSDGTRFKVLNQMVFKRSPWGREFAQFPTTFHEVVFKNGVKKAKQSEEQINKDWLA